MPTPWTCGSRLWLATSNFLAEHLLAEHQLKSKSTFSEFLETWVRRHEVVLVVSIMRRCVSVFETHNLLLL